MSDRQNPAPLAPVPFGKGRERKPRLSAPRVVGRHSSRFWSEQELKILRETYPVSGALACVPLLPRFNRHKIYAQANKLGLKSPMIRVKHIRRLTAEETADLDEKLKDAWPTLADKGAFKRFCEEHGIRRHTVSRRAEILGLSMPRFKEPEWSEAEKALLRKHAAHVIDRIANVFREHGFQRSTNSIRNQLKRFGVERSDRWHFSGTAAARLLGLDNKTTTQWCVQELIKAERRGTQRLPQQGGDAWLIARAELRRFVIENLERIDIRKVDKYDFIELLTGPTEPPPEAEAP
jgi:hypothetical protein